MSEERGKIWDQAESKFPADVYGAYQVLSEVGVSMESLNLVLGFSLSQGEQLEGVRHEANTDYLTGLANRRALDDQMEKEISRAERFGRDLSFLMLDIDRFKIYNDSFGHPEGDNALRALSIVIEENVRHIDFPVRYGGEEFAVILPETDLNGAQATAEKIREAVEGVMKAGNRVRIDGDEVEMLKDVTVSVGVAGWEIGDDFSDLCTKADKALYAAKEGGRNRVEVFKEATE